MIPECAQEPGISIGTVLGAFESDWQVKEALLVEPKSKISPLASIAKKNDRFLDRLVTCDEKRIIYDGCCSTQCLDRDESPKHFPSRRSTKRGL